MSTWPQAVKTFNLIRRLGARPLTIQEVAETVEVQVRQAYRILKMLKEELGVPIDSDEIAGVTRYFLQGNYLEPIKLNLPSVPLTPQEKLVLSHLLRPSSLLEDTSLWDHYSLFLKRVAAEHERYEDLDQSTPKIPPVFSTSTPMSKSYKDQSELLGKLFEAIEARRPLTVTYRSPRSPESRTHAIHPLHVLEHRGGLYLFARFPNIEGQVRLLAVERIQTWLVLKDEAFEYPADFDPQSLLGEAFDLTLGDPLKAVIWFAASETPYIQERSWSSKQSIEVHPDGSCTLTMETSGHDDVARWVLGFGGKAKVREPKGLRHRVINALAECGKQYSLPGELV